ncbi:MAG: prolyl oligopeptidase family serine peptidase [Pseudomonadota bacterium]
MRFLMVCLVAVAMGASPAIACGVETDCMLGDRIYRISMPEDGAATGAIVYMHGYRGSARGAMRNQALLDLAHRHGLALVAAKSAGDDWRIRGVPEDPSFSGDEEFTYFDALIDALEARHGIDRTNLIATGFSAGGMMVWNLACQRGGSFKAFVPIAGTFWAPMPETCPDYPVDMVHIHGTTDKIVPLAGRPIAETHQGDVLIAIDRLVAAGGYEAEVTETSSGDLFCKIGANADRRILAFCTHPGGHSFKTEYVNTALEILNGAPR